MTDVNCYITTFNCGRTLLDVDHFASNFFNGLKSTLPPDLIVLALEEIAPIGYSFLGGSLLVPYFSHFTKAVNLAAFQRLERNNEYNNVLARNVGMTAIMVFARAEVEERIRWIETAGVGCGLWEMGNKGAVGARLGLESEDTGGTDLVTFVAAHLAPMEWNVERRNKDWQSICEGLVFGKEQGTSGNRISKPDGGDASEAEPLLSSPNEDSSIEPHGLFRPISNIYVAGDLNYRTSDTAPTPDDFKNWPQPVESVSDVHHYSHLLERDQLSREMKQDKTLQHMAESDITFPPTYKYSSKAQEEAAKASTKQAVEDEDRAWLWAKHRVPSWCDRILFLAVTPPAVHSYTALPLQPTSDHRPVVLSFSIPLKFPAGAAGIEPPFAIRKDWREARAAARRYEFIVGLGAYLTLTWEGEALLAGTFVGILGGYLVLRSLLGT